MKEAYRDLIPFENIEAVAQEVYRKTYNEVTKFLVKKNPLGRQRAASQKTKRAIPPGILYRYAPAGKKVGQMAKRVVGGEQSYQWYFRKGYLRHVKKEIENSTHAAIENAADAAIRTMTEDRFEGTQEATFAVQSRSVELSKMRPVKDG